jgi:hypothetical protein
MYIIFEDIMTGGMKTTWMTKADKFPTKNNNQMNLSLK